MIENVEGFTAKLDLQRLTKPNVLAQSEINTRGRRTVDNATTCIAYDIGHAGRCGCRIGLETCGVEVLLDGMRCISVRIAKDIRPATGDQGGNESETGRIEGGGCHCERYAASIGNNSRHLPAA